VAVLAAAIFRGLPAAASLPPESLDLLQAAALLHEVGYIVNQESPHKHAYHVIRHAELPGFTAHEIELIANLARYHRGAAPKSSHENFSRLNPDDARLVEILSAVLRVANALDRTRFQRVRAVTCETGTDGLRIVVAAGADAQVEIWDAVEKAKVLEKALDFPVRVEHAADAAARPTSP